MKIPPSLTLESVLFSVKCQHVRHMWQTVPFQLRGLFLRSLDSFVSHCLVLSAKTFWPSIPVSSQTYKSRVSLSLRGGEEMWKEESLDLVLVPAGLAVMVAYHVWLGYTIIHRPKLTAVSLNAESRRLWVFCMMDVRFSLLLFPLSIVTLSLCSFRLRTVKP